MPRINTRGFFWIQGVHLVELALYSKIDLEVISKEKKLRI